MPWPCCACCAAPDASPIFWRTASRLDPISDSIGFEYSPPLDIAPFEYSIFSLIIWSRIVPAASWSLRAVSRWLLDSDCRAWF